MKAFVCAAAFEGFLREAREIDRIGRGSTATHALRRLLRQTRSLQNHCSSPSDREGPAGCTDVNGVRHAEQLMQFFTALAMSRTRNYAL